MCVKLSILVDVSRGLWYLHSHNPPVIHRDLSPNNVLLTSQFVAKISDLGVAKVIEADSKKTKTRAPGTVDFIWGRKLFFFLIHLILNYECKCVYVHNNLILKSSTLFIMTTSIGREFHILMTDGKSE